jgi:hypothetical protein
MEAFTGVIKARSELVSNGVRAERLDNASRISAGDLRTMP